MLVVRVTTDKKKTKKKDKVTTVSLEKIDLCLEMLKSADATDANQAESETTQELEGKNNIRHFKLMSRLKVLWNTDAKCSRIRFCHAVNM